MKEFLEQAAYEIACGLDPDVVINALLLERSVYRPGSRAALGAVSGGALQAYIAFMQSKGLSRRDRLKLIAKQSAKGATIGGIAGYGAQLGARARRQAGATLRHAKRKSTSRAVSLDIKGADGKLRSKKFRSHDYARALRRTASNTLHKEKMAGPLNLGPSAVAALKMLGLV